MESASAVFCHGPRSRWDRPGHAPRKARKGFRWIAAALLVALALAAAALVAADPATGHTTGMVESVRI